MHRLAGLEPERVRGAHERMAAYGIAAVEETLLGAPDLDTAIATLLLADGIEMLVSVGVPESKLIRKLKDMGQFWATWAEIRAETLLVKNADDDVSVTLEPGGAGATQPDLRLATDDGAPAASVEVKSVGLSQAEVQFCHRMAPALDRVIPHHGLATFHAELDAPRPIWTARDAEQLRGRAGRAAAATPMFPHGLSGATIVAHGSEQSYVRRALAAIEKALRQLPEKDECWVSLFWSNGAPVDAVAAALDWDTLPAKVQGLVFVGSAIAFPYPDIHNYVVLVPRGFEVGNEVELESSVDERLAASVLDRVERSAGVRACLLRGVTAGKGRQLLRRDGSRHILPYILLMDADPMARA